MAELQIIIPYKTRLTRAAFLSFCAMFPIWAIVAPAALGFFIGITARDPASVPPWATMSTCIGMILFTLFGIAGTAISEDDRIHVSKDGIAFPPLMVPQAGFKRNRSWQELHSAEIIGTEDRLLSLSFADGSGASLKVDCIKQADLEHLFMAIELWATQCARGPMLLEYQKEVQNAGRETGNIGYTAMWEEELGRRFTATAFMPLEPGRQLRDGDLKIVRQLAFGGLSAIYLAQQAEKGLVVLKEAVVPPGAEGDAREEAERHLLREAEILSQLHHDQIAKVLDHFVEDGRHYLMMEYINGQDLRQFVKQNGPVDEQRALVWARQIIGLLQYLHEQDPPIIHRDLTPDNLVLTNHGDIMLIDFGAANVFVGTATGTIVGKQAYISPEQLRGKTSLQSDLYAFGGTLYYLLTGKDPVPLAESHPAKVNAQVSVALDSIVARCTAFEEAERYLSTRDVTDALRQLSEGTDASKSYATISLRTEEHVGT